MLKNLQPILTGELLRVLDSIRPGQSLALLSGDSPHQRLGLPLLEIPPITVEQAVEAIFSALPLASDGRAPLLSWLADSADENAMDIAYAIRGLATDAELRPIEMVTLAEQRDFTDAMHTAVATLTFPAATSCWAFLIRAGS